MGASTTTGPLGGPGTQTADPALRGGGARSAPLGRAPTATGTQVSNVVVVFEPSGAPIEEAVPAAKQTVYIDLTPGMMTQLQTNAQGRLTGSPASSAVTLDSGRSYQVVVTPDPLSTPPAATAGATVSLDKGKLPVTPKIAIKITRNAVDAAKLACVLTVGTAGTNVTSTAAGWIISNDQTAGAVLIRSARFTLQTSGAAAPAVTLTISPSPLVRAASATIAVNAPTTVVGLKVTQWKYAVSHTNPGATTNLTATITRPAAEDASTFDQKWAGDMCCSGDATASVAVGASVRASGAAAVNVALDAVDPTDITLAVSVAPRTGPSWTAGLTENPVGTFKHAIAAAEDLGHHKWQVTSSGGAGQTVASGPNRGCRFLTNPTANFTSTPEINDQLNDASSAFSAAQGAAYLTSPAPTRLIPRSLYTIGPRNKLVESPPGSIAANFGITTSFEFVGVCISQSELLAGTRRHESEDPLPAAKSHKGNCLKTLRALDPIKFAEALAAPPGAHVDFGGLFQSRVNVVVGVASTHDVVDEAKTLANQAVAFTSNKILDVNADSSGAIIGSIWNPKANRELGS
jgi:hypothetical protein